ncbi:MAG: alpha/beta fold hydrolase [Candidatus Latescibacterota bacterium]
MKRFCLFLCCIMITCGCARLSPLCAAANNAAAAAAENTAGDDIYCGESFLSSGKRVSVFKTGVITELARLAFINWENGRAGVLEKDAPDRFWAAVSPLQADVRQTAVAFGQDEDNATGYLIIQEGSGPEVRAVRKITFTQKPVTFASGDAVLSGILKKPVGHGPFPAVVLVHGSGPGTREQLESMARFFVHVGMAVLSYDKRGCGASSGDWKSVDLEVLADDALAAVSILESEPDIDPGQIGLWGISQGGWITPLAASRSAKVAFVINHSGPGTSLRRQDTYMMSNVLSDQGVPPTDIDLAIAALNLVYNYGRKKASAEELDAAIDNLRGKPGLEEFTTLSSQELDPDSLYAQQIIGDPAWFIHLDPDRDALEPYRQIRCPLLVVFGKLDYTVPVEESEQKISAVLRESGHPDYLVKVLDRTGHGWIIMQKEQPQQPVEPLEIASEYFALLEEWLSRHGLCASGRWVE